MEIFINLLSGRTIECMSDSKEILFRVLTQIGRFVLQFLMENSQINKRFLNFLSIVEFQGCPLHNANRSKVVKSSNYLFTIESRLKVAKRNC